MKTGVILIHGIEIRNPSRSNRGAEQLLRSAVDRVASWGFQPAVTIGKVSASIRCELKLLEYVGNPRLSWLESKLPPLKTTGHCTARGLSGVLDVSGFVLGDAWGTETAGWLQRKFELWREVCGPVVMLPQAFGPFSSEGMARAATNVVDQCAKVYARDLKSYSYLSELSSAASIGTCVDVTLGVRHLSSTPRTNELVLVPNWNLTRSIPFSEYVDTLVGISRWGVDHGMSVVGLLHEGQRDLEILRAVSENVPINVVDNLSGWDVRSRLGSARVIVSGRYHAMLGGLSSGTPVAVHSWSHKYSAALEQFGAADWQCDPSSAQATIQKLEMLVAEDFESELFASADKLATEVDTMWTEVAEVFGK